jgi:hypothetical protein
MERTEQSVMSALKDLQALEVSRRREEEVVRAHREAAEAEAREQVRKAAEARRAEEARRVSSEAAAEAARRDAEASQHMERLRAELAAVQADRQRLHERILDPVVASAVPAPSGTRRGVTALLGLVTVCSLGLATALALRPALPAPPPATRSESAPQVAPVPPLAVPAVVASPELAGPLPLPASTSSRPRPVRPAARPGDATTSPPVPAVDPCENSPDPTCGLEESDAPRRRPRPRAGRPAAGHAELPQDL